MEIVGDGRRVISNDGTLSISGVNNNDIGNYTCEVTSDGGNDTKTVALTVIGRPCGLSLFESQVTRLLLTVENL